VRKGAVAAALAAHGIHWALVPTLATVVGVPMEVLLQSRVGRVRQVQEGKGSPEAPGWGEGWPMIGYMQQV